MFEDNDGREYVVVRNDVNQYSIWPSDRQPPTGWATAGRTGSKADCLAEIAEVWTDMRPAPRTGTDAHV